MLIYCGLVNLHLFIKSNELNQCFTTAREYYVRLGGEFGCNDSEEVQKRYKTTSINQFLFDQKNKLYYIYIFSSKTEHR